MRHPAGRRAGIRRGCRVVPLVLALVAVTSCSTGRDAVVTGGEFTFVAPGGQQTIFYDLPDERGALRMFSGESLADPNRQVGIQNYPGMVLVINVWGSWCGPCRAEMADLQVVRDQARDSGVDILGLNVRDLRDPASDFVRDRNITYDSIFDPPGRALLGLSGYPRNVVPSTIVLDRKHRVAAVYLARIRLAEFSGLLRRLAAEPSD